MLRQRILTAVVLGLALLAVILWLPAEAALAVFALVVLAGAWEWSVFPRFPVLATRWMYVFGVALAMVLMWFYSRSKQHLRALLPVDLASWLLALFSRSLAPASLRPARRAGSRLLMRVSGWV